MLWKKGDEMECKEWRTQHFRNELGEDQGIPFLGAEDADPEDDYYRPSTDTGDN